LNHFQFFREGAYTAVSESFLIFCRFPVHLAGIEGSSVRRDGGREQRRDPNGERADLTSEEKA